jgi:aminobenzoyl-glutamate utilization protein B
MFGAGSLGAAVAIKELIAAGKLKGTIRFGTPAEEDLAGKVYMARAGFNDLDICLDWHPDYETKLICKAHKP